METYKTIAGEVIEYEKPTPAVGAFLARVVAASNDPHVTEGALTELIYGKENPLLDQTIFPGRGAVTRAVLGNPVYHVMLDLLDAKRVQAGTLSPSESFAHATTVSEAARALEVSPGAVRQAIEKGHLVAVKRGAQYFVDSRSVASYRERHTRRGPTAAPALRLKFGNREGASFRVKVLDLRETGRVGRVVEAEVAQFKRAAIVFKVGEGQRMFVLEPAAESRRYEHDGFFVEGKFEVVAKVNNGAEAAKAFKTFEPA